MRKSAAGRLLASAGVGLALWVTTGCQSTGKGPPLATKTPVVAKTSSSLALSGVEEAEPKATPAKACSS